MQNAKQIFGSAIFTIIPK